MTCVYLTTGPDAIATRLRDALARDPQNAALLALRRDVTRALEAFLHESDDFIAARLGMSSAERLAFFDSSRAKIDARVCEEGIDNARFDVRGRRRR